MELGTPKSSESRVASFRRVESAKQPSSGHQCGCLWGPSVFGGESPDPGSNPQFLSAQGPQLHILRPSSLPNSLPFLKQHQLANRKNAPRFSSFLHRLSLDDYEALSTDHKFRRRYDRRRWPTKLSNLRSRLPAVHFFFFFSTKIPAPHADDATLLSHL